MDQKRQPLLAMITGGNSGIGLALAQRLLEIQPEMHICLACRSKLKAESAKRSLDSKFPSSTITTMLMDVADIASVYIAAEEIRHRFHHIDFLFLNAGIMPVAKVDWSHFWNQLFSGNAVDMFTTGDGLLNQADKMTDDGLPQIFATNLFGHFVLVKELEDSLGGNLRNSQIIWTSSSNAKKAAFKLDDFKHLLGSDPYSSSKYATDLVSFALNKRLNQKGIYSHATCPGLVMTNLTYGILPRWIWFFLLPILWLLRVFVQSIVIEPANGCEALVHLMLQPPESLDSRSKYCSCVSVIGRRYTQSKRMDLDTDMALQLYDTLSDLELQYRRKLKVKVTLAPSATI